MKYFDWFRMQRAIWQLRLSSRYILLTVYKLPTSTTQNKKTVMWLVHSSNKSHSPKRPRPFSRRLLGPNSLIVGQKLRFWLPKGLQEDQSPRKKSTLVQNFGPFFCAATRLPIRYVFRPAIYSCQRPLPSSVDLIRLISCFDHYTMINMPDHAYSCSTVNYQ